MAKTKIIGGGGLSVTAPVSYPVGTVLHAKLKNYARVIEFTAEIIWTERIVSAGPPQTEYGLSFAQISQDSLLAIHDIINGSRCRQVLRV